VSDFEGQPYFTARDIRARFGVKGKNWIKTKIASAGFPSPKTRFGSSRNFWLASDVLEWERVMIAKGIEATKRPGK